MELIEEDLNKNTNFLSIDKEPISAASLGQVHKATLKNRNCCCKSSAPILREQITLDLYISPQDCIG